MVDDARPDDYYSVSGIRTGFGSVWTTISNNMSYADGRLSTAQKMGIVRAVGRCHRSRDR
jgi:hypothetical protein